MNERAIELYKQAAEFAYTRIGKDHADTNFFQGVVFGKFAELIVQECVEQVFYTIENEEENNISLSIRNRIKEHFGVDR